MAGGRLITTLSKSSVGPADYTVKNNWRRSRDQEIRREGYIDFSPLAAIADQNVYDAALTCYRLVELVRGDGTKALLGFSRSAVRLFSNTSGTWSTIGSGYSASGKRWQIVMIGGVLVANNAVDLPFYFEVGDTAVTPMYELREVGIASVGRIVENSGFLVILDITEIIAEQLDPWMRGYAAYTVGSTVNQNTSFAVALADSGKQFDVTTGATPRVCTVSTTLVPGDISSFYIWVKKADAGIGDLTFNYSGIAGPAFTMGSINDKLLIWWDSIRGRYEGVYFPGGSIPTYLPYGLIPATLNNSSFAAASGITQRFSWAVANGEYADPTRWAPTFSVLMASASVTITLPFPSTVFVAGRTRVAVVNAGPLGGILGGQEGTEAGVLVTGVSGRTLTLEVTTDAALTYPRIVQILRWEDTSSLVGRYDLAGDNSEITSAASLRNWLVITRTTGIYLGRYTGDPGAPFVFTPAYTGSNVPFWPDAIANIKGDYLLYPGRGGRMFKYDGVTWPEVHNVTDDAASTFFDGYDQDDEVFVVENAITKEWWFCYPDKVVAFDFDTPGGTVSVIDQLFNAAAMIHKPGTTDFWFIMAIGRFIYTYGLAYGLTPIQTWLRDGVAVNSVLKFGLNSFGDEFNEKTVLSYTPILSSQSGNVDLEVQIYSAWNPSATPVALLSPVETLPSPMGRNFIPMMFQALYLQDEITLVEATDIDARLSKRIWEVELVKAGGVTRNTDV